LWIISPDTFEHPDALLNFIENLKQISPLTQILVLTYDPRIEIAVATIKHGAEDYLKLPVSQQTLEKAILKALDQSSLLKHHHELSDLWVLLQNCQQISATTELESILEITAQTIHYLLGTSEVLIFETPDLDTPCTPSSLKLRPRKKNAPVHPETKALQKAILQQFELIQISYKDREIFESNDSFYKIVPENEKIPAHLFFSFKGTVRRWVIFSVFPNIRIHPRVLDQYLKVLHSQTEAALKNWERNQKMTLLAYRDPLTELPNLRALHMQLEHSIEQNQPFGLIFIDIDGFKTYNDLNGHLAGDQLLKETAKNIQKMIRETDDLFRYAGDEFVALLYPSDPDTALKVAKRIRNSVQHSGITISLGLAHFPDDLGTSPSSDPEKQIENLIKKADQALYAAKSAGKNQVIRYNEIDGSVQTRRQ
jgi:diguanylate cyclase (GGDEF)-like protein